MIYNSLVLLNLYFQSCFWIWLREAAPTRKNNGENDSQTERIQRSPGTSPKNQAGPQALRCIIYVQCTKLLIFFAWNDQIALHIDGLGKDCSNSSALAMELLQSCTKPAI